MGDRILSVNEEDIRNASHETAVMSLLSKADQMKLKIQHDPLPKGFQVSSVSFRFNLKAFSTFNCTMIDFS